ncbi:MAG: dTDP-4-dehydrorhamnose reductase [Melioribacteraceae bacterium]|nr:dTDP-4-dehydrorhamnose reductase [Melioribacteraceae bacterium]MCF8394704.1 dTDP-4-dehydrorhamnose reductase [Melioribacteraceae bacterium]MCF8418089.1 dTDP-4-dehydrorhamnose reductase [Melioribacteraceae bacterium]
MDNLIKKRILIVGSNGMLGQRITEFYKNNKSTELMCVSAEDNSYIEDVEYKKIDIVDKSEVRDLIMDFFPDIIINTAAYTNVDGCETEKELSWKINVTGVSNLAVYAQTVDAHLIHISTDYVFDGNEGPYQENDLPNPISYYGRTKLASENTIRPSGTKFTIIRTNVLFGPAKHGRPDFVKWVVQNLRSGKEIKIVTDQINNPTYIDDLVQGISKAAEYLREGIYNIGGPEFLSRYDFTLRIADFFKLDKKLIKKIFTEELNQAARRPLKSGLIILKAETELGYKPHSIEDSLHAMKQELKL